MDLTPERLRLSFQLLKDTPISTQPELIKGYRRVLDELENSIKMKVTLKPPPFVWRFEHWRPVIDTNGMIQIWNPKKHRHGVSPDPIEAAKTNLKAVGTVQFFRDGHITLDTVMLVVPRILAAHCAHLKDRARNNVIKEAVPRIQDALKHLQPNDDPSSIWKLELAQLFMKHLAGAIDIEYIFNHVGEPCHAWAKAAFQELLHCVQNSTASAYSYSQFVEETIKKGLTPPDIMSIPLSMNFRSHPRIKMQAISNLLRDQSGQLNLISDLAPYADPVPSDATPSLLPPETLLLPKLTFLSPALISTATSSNTSSITVSQAVKRAQGKAAESSVIFPVSKRRSI